MPRLTLPTRIASAAIVHQSVPLFTGTVGSRPRTSPPALTKVLCSWVRLEFSRRPVPIWAGWAAGSRHRRFPTAAHLACRNTPPGLGSKRSSPDIPFAKGCIGQESDGLATGLPNGPGPRLFRFSGRLRAQDRERTRRWHWNLLRYANVPPRHPGSVSASGLGVETDRP